MNPPMPLTKELDGVHPGETIILVGCSSAISKVDIGKLRGATTIACNRFLAKQKILTPTYLMASDRRPYRAEMNLRAYERAADEVKLLFSTSMYDPGVKCHGAPVEKPPGFRWYPWRVRGSNSASEWETLSRPLCSFANIGGPMLQAAVIMGAKHVAFIGIGIVTKGGHFYGHEKWAPRHNYSSPQITSVCFQRAKKELQQRGVHVHNLNPKGINPPFERIWPAEDYNAFVRDL